MNWKESHICRTLLSQGDGGFTGQAKRRKPLEVVVVDHCAFHDDEEVRYASDTKVPTDASRFDGATWPVAALSANPIQLADGSRQIRDGALVFDELAQTSEQTVEVLR